MLVDKLDTKQLWGHFHINTKTMKDETNDTLRQGEREREGGRGEREREGGKGERKRGERERGREGERKREGGTERGEKGRKEYKIGRKGERKREGGEEGEGRKGESMYSHLTLGTLFQT